MTDGIEAIAQELPEGTVTVLFSDVEGSTDLTNRLGDGPARDLLRSLHELVREHVAKHRGHEVKGLGDGMMAAFISARRAVACAIDIQRALALRIQQAPSSAARMRIGLNTGEVVREEADLFGSTVNAAARIQSAAEPGQILISDGLRMLLGAASNIELKDRGEFALKGFSDPWHLYEVVWEMPAARPGALPDRTPYVGRADELSQLRQLMAAAVRGQGALVVIGGEPGVGKTRLAEEIAVEAQRLGAAVRLGHCYEMEGAAPYTPLVEMLEAFLRSAPKETFRAALGENAAEVARIMPELRHIFDDIPMPVELPPEQERRFLLNSLGEFIGRASRVTPLLLIFDDLHWADDATLFVLEHLAQQVASMPVLMLGTYRDVDLDVGRPLARSLESLLRRRLAHRIALRRLPEAGVQAMLQAMSGQAPPQKLVDVIESETEGNPFFVEEVVRHLAEEGKLFDDQGNWKASLVVGELEVPEGVRLVIGRRLERLGEDAKRVLGSAAVIGRVFRFDLLEAASEDTADAVLDAIDAAQAAHIVGSADDGRDATIAFAHELFRQTLLSGLSMPRRQRIHLRVADAIERVYARSLDEHAADLAHHLFQAGAAADPEKTMLYIVMAAGLALKAAAFEDALKLCDNGLSVVDPEDRKARADLLNTRAGALRSLNRLDDALSDWDAAMGIYESLGQGEAVGRICATTSMDLLWAGRAEQALLVARRGLAALGEHVNADRCILLAAEAGISCWLPGADYAAAQATFGEALKLAEELGDQHALGMVLLYKADNGSLLGRHAEAFDDGLRGGRLLLAAGAPYDATTVFQNVLLAAVSIGRLDEAEEIARENEKLAPFGNEGCCQLSANLAGQIRVMRSGDLEAFADTCQEALRAAVASSNAFNIGAFDFGVAVAEFWRGHWGNAEEHLSRVVEVDIPAVELLQASGRFKLRAYSAARDEALAIWRERRSDLPGLGAQLDFASSAMYLAAIEGLALLKCYEEVAELYPFAVETMAAGAVIDWLPSLLEKSAGIAAACGHQWAVAEQHFDTSLRQAHDLPHRIEQPEVRRWYAWMLLERDAPGDRERARVLLNEAIAMYRDIGMPKHLEIAEVLLATAEATK